MYLEFSLQVDKSKFTVASCDILGYMGRAYALPACHGCLTYWIMKGNHLV